MKKEKKSKRGKSNEENKYSLKFVLLFFGKDRFTPLSPFFVLI